MLKYIEQEIIERLDKGEKIYIESGALNDCIIGYSVRTYKKYAWQDYEEREITFTTTACVFPEKMQLSDWDNVDSDEFNGELFVQVR